jgi:phosphomethylpyrimidine synthase
MNTVLTCIAKHENISVALLRKNIKRGFAVILANKNHKNVKPLAVGRDLMVKVNANIGASPADLNLAKELKKLKAAIEAGADAVMDLTVSNKSADIDKMRNIIIENCPKPVGTVPVYQAAIESGNPQDMTIKSFLNVFERHAKEGVDFVTVHAGVTKASLSIIKKRMIPVVSRGGSFLLNWMKKNKKENFLYRYFDEILDIAKEYNVTISLGDGLRPGCLADSTDRAQIHELRILGDLALKARSRGVQVIIEGPGHIPLNEIQKNVKLKRRFARRAVLCIGAASYRYSRRL